MATRMLDIKKSNRWGKAPKLSEYVKIKYNDRKSGNKPGKGTNLLAIIQRSSNRS